eukprot:GFUD01030292.1.p1 GENE.GFUD01030292.1~~GFUD01030292.1.p1  ORF type:complete len:236 (+),score=76.61 GFUD01030292.1:344-1051(+)
MRDYDETIKALQIENFDLKLRIFLLEERFSGRAVKTEDQQTEGNTDHQLVKCRKSLSSCVALVEEAAAAIEMLEHKLETQQAVHEETVKNIEEKLIKYENECTIHSEDSKNNNIGNTGTYLSEQENLMKKKESTSDSSVQCDLGLSPAIQEAYCESVKLYKRAVGKLEGKLRWAKEEWREVGWEVCNSEHLTRGNEFKNIFESKEKLLADIFNTENIYDEAEVNESLVEWGSEYF